MVACLNDWGYAGRGSIGGTVPCDHVTQHEQTREKGGKRGGYGCPPPTSGCTSTACRRGSSLGLTKKWSMQEVEPAPNVT